MTDDDVLRRIAADLNRAPDAARRTTRMAALVTDLNTRIGEAALQQMTFDATPHAFQAWCLAMDQR